MGFNLTKVPSIFNSKDRNVKSEGLNALKDIHVSFNGYGLAEGEQVTFPTEAEIKANPTAFIKTMDTYRGSQNRSALFLVLDGNGKQRWFNLSVLSRQMNIDDMGTRGDIDPFRTKMRTMNDDLERIEYLYGKTIKGVSTINGYAPIFGDDRRPTGQYKEAKYVQIEEVSSKKK